MQLVARLLPLSALVLAAFSTMPLQPDYPMQGLQEAAQVTAWSSRDAAQPVSHLEELIGSGVLDTLMRLALEGNPGLQQTLLTLKIRQQEQRSARGTLLPQLDAGLSA